MSLRVHLSGELKAVTAEGEAKASLKWAKSGWDATRNRVSYAWAG
jgi:hypothetical protein